MDLCLHRHGCSVGPEWLEGADGARRCRDQMGGSNLHVFLPGEAISLGLAHEAGGDWTGPDIEVDDETAPVIAATVRTEVERVLHA